MALRNYQRKAVNNVMRHWRDGTNHVCLVSPTGCISGDAMIGINRAGKGMSVDLARLVHMHNGGATVGGKTWSERIDTMVRARMADGTVRLVKLLDAYESGEKPVHRVTLASGNTVDATMDHRFLTSSGWKRLSEVHIGELVWFEPSNRPIKTGSKNKTWYNLRRAILHPYVGRKGVHVGKGGRTVPMHRLVVEADLNGMETCEFIEKCNEDIDGLLFLDPSKFVVHHIDGDVRNNDLSNLKVLTVKQHKREHLSDAMKNISVKTELSHVVSITPVGTVMTYDLSLEEPHNFLANGIVVHNSGKTVMLCEIAKRARAAGAPVLWVAHRNELVAQAKASLKWWGVDGVQVETVQTMVASGRRPNASLLVWDECHHVCSDEWSKLKDDYSGVRSVGATATPARGDGRPLGDMFDELVVAAQYSELIKAGHIVDCEVYAPPSGCSQGMAMLPLDAYRKYGADGSAFCFTRTIEDAYETAESFNGAGIPAGVIEAETDEKERVKLLSQFGSGETKILCNVFVLTEGIDVPAADVCLLTRGVGHPSTFIQMVGRVLRASPGKTHGTLIDLVGASMQHGLPTADRRYSLDGREGVLKSTVKGLRVCAMCGYTYEGGAVCPRCGYDSTPVRPKPRIYDVELSKVYAWEETPSDAKLRELKRLQAKGYGASWVCREYKKLFGSFPSGASFPEDDLREMYQQFRERAQNGNYKPGYALARYREIFGVWPPMHW